MGSDKILKEFEILAQLKTTGTKRLIKASILEENHDNERLQKIFWLAYDWETTFGIAPPKKLPVSNYIGERGASEIDFKQFEWMCAELASRNITGNAARDEIYRFLTVCDPDDAVWYQRILGRDLKIGMGRNTVQRTWPGLIKKFGVQLARKYEPKRIKFPVLVEPKFDGMRATIVVQSGVGTAYSRSGHILSNVQFIADIAAAVDMTYDFVLDGELFCNSWNDTLKYVKTVKNPSQIILDKLKNELEFHIFDALPAVEFHKGKCDTPFYENPWSSKPSRVLIINQFLEKLEDKANFRAVERKMVDDQEELDKTYLDWLQEGYEGAMIKVADAPYVGKRSWDWMKYKPFHSIDCEIIDVLEGQANTKYVGKLGALLVRHNDKTFKCGSGLSDEQRESFWGIKETLIGQFVEIKINEDMGEKQSVVNFPVFMRLRVDKNE